MALLAPEALPSSSRRTLREDDVRDRREEERHPDPRDHERGHEARSTATVGLVIDASQARPIACSAEPGRHQRPPADPVRERAGDRRDEDRHRRPRQRPEAGLERGVALHGLQELREQEDRAEHPEEHEERGDVGRRERPVPEEPHRQHRRLACGAPRGRTPPRNASPSVSEPRISKLAPADRVAADEARARSRRGRCWRGRGRAGRAASRARRTPSGGSRPSGTSTRPIGHVEPEDPLPREAFDDRAADDRAERDAEAADAAPRAERERRASRAARPRERIVSVSGSHDRAAEPLHRAGGDQRLDVGRERGRRGRDREDAEPDRRTSAAGRSGRRARRR